MNPIARARLAWLLACLAPLVVVGAAGASLTLREAVSTVTASPSADGRGQAVSPAAAVAVGQFVRTGPDSLAEFVSGNGVLRLGSQTTIYVAEPGGQIRLEQGAALFDRLPNQVRLTVALDEEPVLIEGGVGFAVLLRESEGKALLHVGSLAGRTTVRRGAQSRTLAPAQVLSLAAGGQIRVGAFHLTKQFESSKLVNGFTSPLPDRRSIEREAARFASLQRRGFVQPERLPEAGPAEEKVPQFLDGRTAVLAGQAGGVGLSGQPSVAGQLGASVAGFGFQSRIVVIGGHNNLGNGADPSLPGWANPRNPHFGSPQNDPPPPGNPGRGRGNVPRR